MEHKVSRLFGLDLIRAIAISLVVLSHCTFLLCPGKTAMFLDVVRLFGAVGVDLFFVLSGYLIGGLLLKQIASRNTNFKDLFTFWKRRWLRTLPNYALVLILNSLLLLVLGKEIVNNVYLYVPFLQNFSTQHPDFFTEA